MPRGRRGAASRATPRAPPRTAARRPEASSTPARAASTSAPAPMQQQPASSGGGMLSGIGSTIAQGMAFGTGSAIAHRAVGAAAGAMSGGAEQVPTQEQPLDASRGIAEQPMAQQRPMGPCAQDKQMFFECLQTNRGDQQACSFLYENLKSCQSEQNQMQFG